MENNAKHITNENDKRFLKQTDKTGNTEKQLERKKLTRKCEGLTTFRYGD